MVKTPGITRVATTDGLSAFFLLMLCCVGIIYVIGGYMDGFTSEKLGFLYIIASFLIVLIYLRFIYLKPLLISTIEHKGFITDVTANYTTGGSIFHYIYSFNGKERKTFNLINSFGHSKVDMYKKGDEIVLLLTSDGNRSLIKDAYY